MAGRFRVRAGAVVLAAVAAGVTACGGSDEPAAGTPSSAGTPTAAATSAAAGPLYAEPASLCEAADQSPLADLFPKDGGQPIADGPGLCATSRSSAKMTVTLSVDAVFNDIQRHGRETYEGFRREARSHVTDVTGVGTAAGWTSDGKEVELFAYHGNLFLVIQVAPLRTADRLPDGVPERVARVASSVFTNLSP